MVDRFSGSRVFFSADGESPNWRAIEGAVLGRLFSVFPAFLSPEEMVRELVGEDADSREREAIARATRQLADEGLLHFYCGLLTPTRAALRARELLGDDL